MPFVQANGVQVNFPFEPYPCQVDYMDRVVSCLRQGENGILESPTGTGKTLCLLCSSLAWLEDKKAQITSQRWKLAQGADDGGEGALGVYKQELAQQLDQAAGAWSGEFAAPKIIYASRTHSQLTQAVQELKRTAYSHFKVSVLGSREQMCIHPQVMKEESNSVKVHLCRAKVTARSCHFYNNVENSKHNFMNQVMDIEDLVNMGKKFNCCPYYVAREMKSDADIIFLPYNYLLDPKSRKAHGVELQGNIVIFDEAHNLEKICEDSASFDLTSTDIASAVREIGIISTKIQELCSTEENSGMPFGAGGADSQAIGSDFTLEDVLKIKLILMTLEEELDKLPLQRPQEGATKPGSFIFELLGKAHLTFETKSQVVEILDKLITFLTNEGGSSAFNTKGNALSKFGDVIKIVFSREPGDAYGNISNHQQVVSKFYKVHIRQTPQDQRKGKGSGWGANPSSNKQGRTLSYWCFSPGHTMEELKSRGVRSIILTSGTLSPMSSFKSEMGIEFKVELENPHVIERHQVWVGTVGQGPDGTSLCSDYNTRFREDYQASLGNAVVNFARVVPSGLLLFFPSYPVMDKCISNWQGSNIWQRVEQYKPVYVEPRNKFEFQTAMEGFYDRVNDPTNNGAAFAAVCRGKVSEGLDFADNNGRAVVITGLPFPPRMDPKVVLKMQFLDDLRRQGGKGLSGQEWYTQQASRAVNQAVGRVIRHKQDFGAIILCDRRFAQSSSISQLPSWVRPYCTVYNNFGAALKDMMVFFKTAEKLLPAPRSAKRRTKAAGCEGAHFEPSMSRSLGMSRVGELQKSSAVVSHVPSLQKPDDGSSLARLKVQYEGGTARTSTQSSSRGLIDALATSEKRHGSFDEETPEPGTSFQSLLKESQDSRQKSKKKILIKGTKTVAEVSKSGLQSAEEYLAEVKKTLSTESYKLFSQTLVKYKASGDFDSMVVVLADIFTDSPAKYPLFRSFYRFVRSKHKAQFDEMCRSLTGTGCGYKPEDSLPAKKRPATDGPAEAAEKKMKMSSSSMDTKSTGKSSSVSSDLSQRLDSRTNMDSASNLNPGTSSSSSVGAPPVLNPTNSVSSRTSCRSSSSGSLFSSSSSSSQESSESSNKCASSTQNDSNRTSKPSEQPTDTVNKENVVLAKSCDKTCDDKMDSGSGSSEQMDSQSSQALGGACGESGHLDVKMYLTKKKSGYTCCRCKEDALIPLRAQCEHVACLECWKLAINETKSCPECGQRTKRRQLQRVFFPSGPNLAKT